MKFRVTFTLQPDPGKQSQGIARFKKIGTKTPDGAKLIGRLTRADLNGGFALLEANDPKAPADFAYGWSDLIELSIVPVIEDEGLAQVFGGTSANPKRNH